MLGLLFFMVVATFIISLVIVAVWLIDNRLKIVDGLENIYLELKNKFE